MRRTLLVTATVAALIVPGFLSAQGASALTIEQNYGGYSIRLVNPDPQNDPLGASAIWTVPAVSCTENGTAITNTVAAWVGLGGVLAGNGDLEQTGTADQCNRGVVSYWPWYEFTGRPASQGGPQPVNIANATAGKDKISQGDNMAADVVEQGPGYFVTQLWDHTKGWYYAAIWQTTSSSATPQTAEWIVEDENVAVLGGPPLPKFTPAVLFQNCYWAKDGVQHQLGAGSAVTQYQIYTNAVQVATTSPRGADNMSFSVAWKNYG